MDTRRLQHYLGRANHPALHRDVAGALQRHLALIYAARDKRRGYKRAPTARRCAGEYARRIPHRTYFSTNDYPNPGRTGIQSGRAQLAGLGVEYLIVSSAQTDLVVTTQCGGTETIMALAITQVVANGTLASIAAPRILFCHLRRFFIFDQLNKKAPAEAKPGLVCHPDEVNRRHDHRGQMGADWGVGG
jgi:hypothetical protein